MPPGVIVYSALAFVSVMWAHNKALSSLLAVGRGLRATERKCDVTLSQQQRITNAAAQRGGQISR